MEPVSRRNAIGMIAASAVGAAAGAHASAAEKPANGAPAAEPPPLKKMSLKEFTELKEPPEVDGILKRLNGGAFMCCHTLIREQTGIWIPDLVPVFQKLDARLAFKELPRELVG